MTTRSMRFARANADAVRLYARAGFSVYGLERGALALSDAPD